MPLKIIEENELTASYPIDVNKSRCSFKDLEEMKSPVEIDLEVKKKTSEDQIVFTDRDTFIERLFEKLESDKKKSKVGKKNPKEQKVIKADLSGEKRKIGLLARAKNFIKDIKNDSKKETHLSYPINKAKSPDGTDSFEPNINIEYPGDINLENIDKNLSNPDLKVMSNDREEPEVLGVNRANVFYNIEKQIRSTRSTSIFSNLRLKNIKKGLFLPLMIALSSFVFLVIAGVILLLYFKSISTATLEDNIIKDESILAKIAKQKDEEARLAALRLEEERRKLEDEKNRLESTINEELLRREAEIQNKYQEKMRSLESSGVSENETEKLKKEYELKKEEELKKARDERDEKIVEQSNELIEKDEKLKLAVENLKKESASYENELVRIKEEFELRRAEEEKKAEEANIQIRKLQETERTIKDFNQTIYQLIFEAMSDFKENKQDSAVAKLSEVLKYYNSRLEFVNSNTDLKNKMLTDVFFVETINSLIEESKNSVVNDREYMKIVNKFKKIAELYQRAENLHTDRQFEKSVKEYEKVLEEFNEVNVSYQRLKEIEKRRQNEIASKYYDEALSNIENKQYQNALNNLTAIIKETPISDYTNQASNNLVATAELLSHIKKVNKDNENAVVLYEKAEILKENEQYNDALKIYQDIITDYPFSDYTKNSLDSIRNINDRISSQGIEDFSSNLNNKFASDFKNYKYYYDKGDIETARIYYFEALKNAFDIYANNSISQFKKVEDAYIEELLRKNILRSEDYFNAVLEQQGSKLKKLQDEKEILEKKYNEKSVSYQDREKIEADIKKVIEEKYRLLKEKELEEEKIKIKNEFDRELAKIKGNIFSNETPAVKEGKYLARITNVIRSSVTFEFIILNKYSKIDLKINDELQVIRLSGLGISRKEINIGKIKVSYISSNSLYGSGNIIFIGQGMNIEKGDLLIKL